MWSRRIARPSVCAALATLVSLVAACAPQPSVAELGITKETPDLLAVELAAARHLLTEYADLEVMLHPAFGDSISAPGTPGLIHRDPSRSTALARALGGTVEGRRDSREKMKGTAMLVLSEPAMRIDTARVTGTVTWYRDDQRRIGSGYRTDRLTITRDAAGIWRVVRVESLGIT
jgi:hypothetical protein